MGDFIKMLFLKCTKNKVPQNVIELAETFTKQNKHVIIHKVSGYYKISTQEKTLSGKPKGKVKSEVAYHIKSGIIKLCSGSAVTNETY